MRFTKQWGLVLGSMLLLAGVSARAYEVDPKTQQIEIVSLQDFDLCIKNLASSGECLQGLIRYAEKKPRDAFQAGKKARLQYRSWAALPLFEIALRKKVDKAVCEDEDFQIALGSALALPPDRILDMATQLGFTKCWNEVKAGLIKEAEEDGSSYFRDNTCPLFTVKGLTLKVCEPKVAEQAPAPSGPRPQILALKDLKWQSLKLDQESAIALRGAEDEQVLLVKSRGPDNLFVLKFKNVRGVFNNQVFVVREFTSPTGREYVTLVDNDEWVMVRRRDNWTAGMYQSYLKGYPDGLKVYRGALVDQAGPGSTSEIVREFGK
jgi:hypothetical protein